MERMVIHQRLIMACDFLIHLAYQTSGLHACSVSGILNYKTDFASHQVPSKMCPMSNFTKPNVAQKSLGISERIVDTRHLLLYWLPGWSRLRLCDPFETWVSARMQNGAGGAARPTYLCSEEKLAVINFALWAVWIIPTIINHNIPTTTNHIWYTHNNQPSCT